jgi:hypothetical protein
MAGRDHGGDFSLDAAVRIEGPDRAGLERMLRYSRPLTLHLGAAVRRPRRPTALRPRLQFVFDQHLGW